MVALKDDCDIVVDREALSYRGRDVEKLVVDERTEESFTVPTSEMERFFYAFSTLHCLAVSMQDGGAGTGTVIRAVIGMDGGSTSSTFLSEAGRARFELRRARLLLEADLS